MIRKIENRFSSLYIALHSFIALPYLQVLPLLRSPLSFSSLWVLVKGDNVRYGAVNGCRRGLHRGPRQSREGVAVPVSLSVSVTVPQAAGRHQAAGASAVAAPVCGGHRAASRRARLLPQHGRGAVREEAVEQQVVILGGGGRRGGCGGHHHVVMLARERGEQPLNKANMAKLLVWNQYT